MLSLADVLLVIIIFGFAFAGFFFGLIHTLGSLVGTVAGFILASKFAPTLSGWISVIFGESSALSIISFIIVFLVASRLVGFLFWLVQKVFDVISLVPFLKSINRLLGAVLGFAEGIIVTGAVLYYASSIIPEWILSLGGSSVISGYLVSVFTAILVFLPFI